MAVSFLNIFKISPDTIGEELGETARREVLEETGIDSEFIGVLCMRHLHGFRYNCSDFYYVCLMKALNTDIKKCDQELQECTWMDVCIPPCNHIVIDSV